MLRLMGRKQRPHRQPNSPERASVSTAAAKETPPNLPLLQALLRSRLAQALAAFGALAATAALMSNGCSTNTPPTPHHATPAEDPHAPRTFKIAALLRQVEAMPPHEFTAQEYVRLAAEIEALGLASVEWHHPDGATEPRDPLLLIPFAHPDPNGNVRNDDQYALLHTTYAMCRFAERKGLRAFGTEGIARGGRVDGTIVDGNSGRTIPATTIADALDDVGGLRRLLKQGVNISTLYAAGMEASWSGVESPEALGKLAQGNPEFGRLSAKVQEFLTALRNTPRYPNFDYRYDPDADILTLNGHTAFPAAALERDLQNFLHQMQQDATGPLAKEREAAAAAAPAGIVLFGTSHTPGILAAAKGKRSVAVLRPYGMPPAMTVERDPTFRNAQNMLALLRDLRSKR